MLNFGIETFSMSPGLFETMLVELSSYAMKLETHGFIARQSSILYQDRELSRLYISGILCSAESLTDAKSAVFLRDLRERINRMLLTESSTSVFECANSQDEHYCDHDSPASLTLICDHAFGCSPLRCTACFGTAAPYRLDIKIDTLRRLWLWDNDYSDTHRLWLRGGVNERWASQELIEVNSSLNAEGLSVAKLIAGDCGCEVFYSLFDREDAPYSDCPRCGNTLVEVALPYPRGICKRCSILT